MEFTAWPKIARLNREMVVTEKIDGTNAAVIIQSHGAYGVGIPGGEPGESYIEEAGNDYSTFVRIPISESLAEVVEVGAQSRKRLIAPQDDNFGFARWVWENAESLVKTLGEGRHYGEWWGSGIQRGYGLAKGEKRFSLFNVSRYEGIDFASFGLDNVAIVPVLWRGMFDQEVIRLLVRELRQDGSFVNGLEDRFLNPEGVIVYHAASNTLFKVLCENDDAPKSLVEMGALV